MIHFDIIFEKYDWMVEVYIILEHANNERILNSLDCMKCPEKIKEQAEENLHSGVNSGFTYTNPKIRKSLMVVNRSSSMYEFINTYNHEKNHVEMHICEELGVDPYSEEAAYLSGELASQLFLPALCSFVM